MMSRTRDRKTALIPFRDGQGFLDAYYCNDGGVGGVRVPLKHAIRIGEEVDLELVFASENIVFCARGIARWRRLADRPHLPAGIGIEFLPSDLRTRDLLLDFARGRGPHVVRRQSRRFHAAVIVEYKVNGVSKADITDNISRHGAFIRTEATLEVGSRLHLLLKPQGMEVSIEVDADIVWKRTAAPRGVGVRFLVNDKKTQQALNALIDAVRNSSDEPPKT